MNLGVEVAQRIGHRVLHDGRQRFKLLRSETLLDEPPLVAPGVSLGGEQTLSQEVAHALHLNFGLMVVLRVRLQHMLNDGRIDGDDRFFETTQIDTEGVPVRLGIPGQNLCGIAGHCGRIRKTA